MDDVTYGQAKKKLHLCLLQDMQYDAMRWLSVLIEKAEGDEKLEGEVDEIYKAIMAEDSQRLEELIA